VWSSRPEPLHGGKRIFASLKTLTALLIGLLLIRARSTALSVTALRFVNFPRCLQTREYESIGASVAICGTSRVGNMSLN
jgi:hypothetical protein